jgi:uncharacterized Fe-S cluster-containing radical SAM superfamily protein
VTPIDFSILPKQLFSKEQLTALEKLFQKNDNSSIKVVIHEAIIEDFFTEDFNNIELMKRKLEIIQKIYPGSDIQTKYVSQSDEQKEIFGDRKALNLVIKKKSQ